MTLSIKEGVRLAPECALTVAFIVCNEVMAERKYPCVITSGLEGKHSRGSLHYIGHAFDVRHNMVPENQRDAIKREMQSRLGADFDVVLEGSHFHIELQPKTGVNS